MSERLKALREQANHSQEGIAAIAGVSQVTWSNWEKQPPSQLDALIRISRHYQISADYLLGLSDRVAPPGYDITPEEKLLAQLSRPQRAIVRALLALLVRQSPEDRQFTLEVIERLLLPVQPHIIGGEDEPAPDPESD